MRVDGVAATGEGDVAVGARGHRAFDRLERSGSLFAVRARYDGSDFGSSGAYVAETYGRTESFLVVTQFRDHPATDGWRGERHFDVPMLRSGTTMVHDLRHSWATVVAHPFDNVHFNVGQALINDLAEELGVQPGEIDPAPFDSTDDPVIYHLAQALLPAFDRPCEVNALFADHVHYAVAIHVAQRLGVLSASWPRGGLAPWQERRAKDMILSAWGSGINLATLASACGLSPRHFARAFRHSVGLPPHQWLLHQRVGKAKALLLDTDEPLPQVAVACGFADQSHMTRVFSRLVGTTPRAWRIIRRS